MSVHSQLNYPDSGSPNGAPSLLEGIMASADYLCYYEYLAYNVIFSESNKPDLSELGPV